MATAHRITGPIDPDRFITSFDAVVRASDALRTVVDDRPGRPPAALVLHDPPGHTTVVDLRPDEFDTWHEDRISRPIDATTCAYDSVLLRHGDDEWTWWLDLHHVVTDGWSSMLVFEAVADAYRALGDGETPDPTSPSFHDHAAAVSVSEPPVPDTPVPDPSAATGPTHPPTAISPYGPRGVRSTAVTQHDVETVRRLDDPPDRYRTFSAELTTTTLLATALAVAISRLDGRRQVVLGLPIHHRRGSAREVIGPLMNLAPLRVEVDPDASFGDHFDAVHREILATIRSGGDPDTNAADSGFDAVVNVQTARYAYFAGLSTVSTWHRSGHVEAAHPVRLHAYDYGDGLRVELDLATSLSLDGAHLGFPAHLALVLDAALADPNVPAGDVDLLTVDDRELLETIDVPALPRGDDRPVHDVIAERLRLAPDEVVAEHDGAELTARALDERADQLAAALVAQGVERGDAVGIRLPRGLDLLVAVHGVLRSGAAFVLLDPDDPAGRHEAIVDDARLNVVIDDVEVTIALGDDGPVTTPSVGRTTELDDLAYVIYTSGSTGRPKGVPITHRGLADYAFNAVAAYADDPDATATEPGRSVVMPLYTSVVFDLAITSLFLPQLVGGRTVVVGGDPVTALSTIAADQRINVLKATPSQLEILCRLARGPSGLEVVIVGGEAFRRPVAESVAALAPGVRIFNEYGPAEAVVGCMLHEWNPEVDTGVDVPIGRSTPGAELLVLDERRRPVPPGAWGELYVWRTGMAEGYLGLPVESRAKFAPVPGFGDRVRYRTGDRVRLAGSVLVYGGRTDDQLSVSGVRLEPGEIETALVRHPGVTNAVVRVWTPASMRVRRCDRCGLGDDVPDVRVGDDGVCSVCRDFERIEPQTRSWFRSEDDLAALLESARRRADGDIDCLHLLSGGKDSTYALYQLVERGWRVHALTLDNGFISDGAKENIRRSVADLGISHEFVTTDAMNEIFRDSLERFSNVCNGCYKTIYTLATARAHDMGIPVIVTGLSRGQFFETRLVPHQFEADRFDPDAIDRTVLQARRAYHATRDAVTDLLPEQEVFDRPDLDVLAEIDYVDFYRYVDVELAEMYDFLERRAPWVRPDDTGRSTNCLVNVVGIHTHLTERGFHNYAEPYSWDVRLGHKTRAEALDELDDDIDPAEIEPMLEQIGYRPEPPAVLTAWYQTEDDEEIPAKLLTAHLRELLPERAVPSAFVHVDELPLADSTKLDVRSLPAPAARHLGSSAYTEPSTPTEATIAEIWSKLLSVDRVGADDDFFDLGGASLLALETVAAVERRFDIQLDDALVFQHRTVTDLAAAVDEVIGSSAALDEIPAPPDHLPLPLSPGEEAMLFEYRSDPGDLRYNITRHYTVDASIDVDRFRRAVEQVVERHHPLHTSYAADRRRLDIDAALAFDVITIDPLADGGAIDDVVERHRRTPFDLDSGPLVRVSVGRSRTTDVSDGTSGGPTGEQWDVVIGMHHISIDAGTFDVFWDEVDAAYHERDLPELGPTYAAVGAWQRAAVPAPTVRSRDDIAGVVLPDVPDVAADDRHDDGYISRSAPITTSELARAAHTTPFAASLAATAAVLGAYTRDGAVELGVTASTKNHPAAAPLIGYFLNSLPLVVDVDGDATLADLDMAAGTLIAEALPRRAEPFAEVVRTARDAGRRPPSITHMLAYERLAPARFGDTIARHRIVAAPTAVNDLTFFVQERGDDLQLGLEHRGTVVSPDTAERLLDAFNDVLLAICRTPGRTVDEVRSALLADDLVGPPLAEPPPSPVGRAIEFAADRPDAVAVVEADGTTTSYADVVQRGAAIASLLQRTNDSALAIRPTGPAAPDGHRVGVCLPRSSRVVEAIVGIHLAGAAYVPLDPASPTQRMSTLMAAADLTAVIVDDRTAALVADADPGVALVDVSSLDTTDAVRLDTAPPSPTSAAYVIFTSGSTGEPAGVEVSHANLAASTAARDVFYGAAPDRFLVTPSLGFDSSMVGIFWPLATGRTIVMPSDTDAHDVDRLGDLIEQLDVSHVLMVPSLYHALLERRPAQLGRLRTAIVAGEACNATLVRRHHELLPRVELVNEYGPTEATVWATAHRCTPVDDPVPIGLPIAGTTVRVADERQHSMAVGATGELLISGPGVVDGYRTGRSGASFVDDGDHRWYRTGDLVRLDDHGRVIFVGRVDDQLNVGGLRIEPLEIEAVIDSIDGVDGSVVTAAVLDGRESLVAHVIADPTVVGVDTVRAAVAARLGATAAPRRVVHHTAIPRTANGKLDRSAAALLPVDPSSHPQVDVRPAADAPLTSEIVRIWSEALGRDDVGAESDFFELGGDSLAAVAVVTALGEIVGDVVPVAALLTSPTPDAMARSLSHSAPLGSTSRSDDVDRPSPPVAVVTLRPGEPGGPTVVMTPAWDDVMGYHALAGAFADDVRVLAIVVTDAATDDGSSLSTMDDLGEVSLGVALDALGHGIEAAGATEAAPPLAVLGWSVGGVAAYDLGRRLAHRGVTVDGIVLVDTIFPGHHRHVWANRWSKYASLLRGRALGEAVRELRTMARRRLDKLAVRAGRRLMAWGGQPVRPPAAATTASGVPHQALDSTPTPTDLPVLLLAATTTSPKRTVEPWGTVASRLHVVPVEGRHRGHQSVMGADRVGVLAGHVDTHLLRSER